MLLVGQWQGCRSLTPHAVRYFLKSSSLLTTFHTLRIRECTRSLSINLTQACLLYTLTLFRIARRCFSDSGGCSIIPRPSATYASLVVAHFLLEVLFSITPTSFQAEKRVNQKQSGWLGTVRRDGNYCNQPLFDIAPRLPQMDGWKWFKISVRTPM